MSVFLYQYDPAAVLRVRGEDAEEYLQSQFSANLVNQKERLATYGLWLSRKGKVEGDGFALRSSDEDFWVVSYHCEANALKEKILSNLVADDVDSEDRTNLFSGISLWGEGTASVMAEAGLAQVQESTWSEWGEVLVFRGRRTRGQGFELVGPKEEINHLIQRLLPLACQQGGKALEENEVNLARIDARIPLVPEEIGPKDLPQEGFLEEEAISFDKGCFLGQEVMARLRSLGGVQRKLWVVEALEKGLSAPCDLYANGQIVGTLKTRYPKENKEIGVAMLKTKRVNLVRLHGISLKPNTKPSISLLHEFN